MGPVLFSSFRKLIECATFYLEQAQLSEEERIRAFFDLDRGGAGAEGRDSWEEAAS